MGEMIVLVDRHEDFKWERAGRTVSTTRDYISRPVRTVSRSVKVINLSRGYEYAGYGYYCSLLAEARGHKVVPSASTILDLNQPGGPRLPIERLEKTLQATINKVREAPVGDLVLYIFFGRPDDSRFRKLARQTFDLFRCPILRLRAVFEGGWRIRSLKPVPVTKLTLLQEEAFVSALDAYTRVDWRPPKAQVAPRYDLAILYDPHEALPPSNAQALERFARVGKTLGMDVELIQKRDFSRLAEYDALFIRTTTAIDHHTFRFAKKAAREGMPVIDDPMSILRCTNKVFLWELLAARGLPTPKTMVVDRRYLRNGTDLLPFPLVLKVPDGSFSRGMVKVESRDDFEQQARTLLKESDVILAQEFMYTDFDWRVGVLNGRPLFVSQYRMAKNHWQIYHHSSDGRVLAGGYKTFSVERAPPAVVNLGVTAANLIGDGLYGVDIKENRDGVFVVEINDNPNIDAGIEDSVLKDLLYRTILEEFVRRIEIRGRPSSPTA